MITLYVLKGCNYCTNVLDFLSRNTIDNLLIFVIDKKKAINFKSLNPRLNQYPALSLSLPRKDGTPKTKSQILTGTPKIMSYFGNIIQNKKLNGTNIDINLYNNNNGNIQNIRKYKSNCFGTSKFNCHVMDRPFGPTDNKLLLQNYQPKCSIPIRSNLPIKSKFGNVTTPGTKQWQNETKSWPHMQIPILKYKQDNNLNINYPLQFKNNNLNTQCGLNNKTQLNNDLKSNLIPKSKFGKYVSALDNSNAPFLTYGAGATTDSRVTNTSYFNTPQQNPINLQSNGYIKGNLKKYVNNSDNQNLLKNGFNSSWSINGQNINNFGANTDTNPKLIKSKNNSEVLAPTAFNSEQGNFAVAQYFKRDMNINNGNAYGKKKKLNMGKNLNNKVTSKKFVSPLGIEINFLNKK
jgi:hypothetical protein